MAILNVNYFSNVLGITSSMNVIIPETRDVDEKFPVLYLLHGYSDDHNGWLYNTSLVKHIEKLFPNLCVVMPAGDTSFYCDMEYGRNYYTHLSQELPKIISAMFPVSQVKEDTFIAGLSMGGYGALKISLANYDMFSKSAMFSGVLDLDERILDRDSKDSIKNDLFNICGPSFELKDIDNTIKLAQIATKKNCPEMLICCGKKDFLYENNLSYISKLDELGIKYKWMADDGYEHTWGYWDICIQRALRFFRK